MIRSAICIIALSCCFSCLAGTVAKAASSNLTLTSSSQYLADAFNWNKSKALSWVQTGAKPGYIPCYWAGYKSRLAFYERDIAHQAEGAALLGLNNENFCMWQKFAASATKARGYYSLWALDFYGNTYALDHTSDTHFVREIPAPLEMVDKANTCYKWSADARWITDPTLKNYYDTTTGIFITTHDENGDGIAQEHGTDIFDGVASYNEWGVGLGEAADGVACQWAAYNSYASLLTHMGDAAKAAAMKAKARNLQSVFVKSWWNPESNNYYAGKDLSLANWVSDFGKEIHTFLAVKSLAEPGARADALLDKMHEHYQANLASWNFEAYTYLPESFYNYGRNDRGWYWLKKLLDSHYDYPEISFTAIEGIATGMMGIEPDAPNHKITTLGRLTSEVGWVQLDHIPIGKHDVLVKHENANMATTVRNNRGKTALTWEAQFPGSYPKLYVDGVAHKASHKTINGVVVSYTTVTLAGGQQKTITTGPKQPTSPVSLPNKLGR